MKLIVITPPQQQNRESEQVIELFENGLQLLHLRKPDFTFSQMEAYLKAIPSRYHKHIVVHSYPELLQNVELKGFHFTEKARATHLSTITHLPGTIQFSTSFHQLSYLAMNNSIFAYVFLSPVFNSISKHNYLAAFSEDELQKTLNETAYKVIALGGVGADNLEKAKRLGFAGVALLGAIWQSPHPVKAFLAIRTKLLNG